MRRSCRPTAPYFFKGESNTRTSLHLFRRRKLSFSPAGHRQQLLCKIRRGSFVTKIIGAKESLRSDGCVIIRPITPAFSTAPFYPRLTLAPKGVNAKPAILKHCFPKGIPIIVIQKKIPLNADSTAMGIPPKTSHKIFKKTLPVPPVCSTVFPKGDNANFPSLKHCFPTGSPTIVIDHRIPTRNQDSACQKPPKRNHNTFPMNDISSLLSCQQYTMKSPVPLPVGKS